MELMSSGSGISHQEMGAGSERAQQWASFGNEWHVTGPAAPHGRYMPKSAELTEE